MIFSSLLFLFRFLPAVLDAVTIWHRARCGMWFCCSVQPGFLCVGRTEVCIILMLVYDHHGCRHTGGILVDRFKAQGKRKSRQKKAKRLLMASVRSRICRCLDFLNMRIF